MNWKMFVRGIGHVITWSGIMGVVLAISTPHLALAVFGARAVAAVSIWIISSVLLVVIGLSVVKKASPPVPMHEHEYRVVMVFSNGHALKQCACGNQFVDPEGV